MKPKKYIESLQFLRAMAALLVFLFHGSAIIKQELNYSFVSNIFLQFGYSGVDIFFVLSGFIMVYACDCNDNLEPKEFLLRRFYRIYPLYWITLSLTLIILFCVNFFLHIPTVIYDHIAAEGFLFLVKSILLLPSSIIVTVSWTLSLEIIFYLLFAFFFFRSGYIFYLVMILIVIFGFCNKYFLINSLDIFNPIIIEFLYGCITAELIIRYAGKFSNWILNIGFILYILSTILSLFLPPFLDSNIRVFIFGIPAAFMVYGVANLKYKFPQLLIYLGDASYSIYLFHYIFFLILVKGCFLLKMTNLFNEFICASIICICVIFICCCIYSFIEKPLLKFGRKKIALYMNKNNKIVYLSEDLKFFTNGPEN